MAAASTRLARELAEIYQRAGGPPPPPPPPDDERVRFCRADA